MQILFNVFFFQAEDGIRDVAVTGVQTCALPISRLFAPTRTERTTRPSSRCARAAAGYGGRGVFRYAAGTSGCGEDRKSTRLNSSHGYISYAVFCLKKKNIKHDRLPNHIFKVMHKTR